MSGVAARFYVAEVTGTAYGPKGGGRVKLQAVSRGDQNKDWAAATPSGTIEMQINNPPAFRWFAGLLSEDIDLTFTAATRHEPDDGHPFRESLADPTTAYGPPNCGDCGWPEGKHVQP